MIRRPPSSTLDRASAASDVYKRQVDEGIHFLLDDVGDFANGALEQRCRFDDRQADRPVAVALKPRTDGVLEQLPELGFVGQDVCLLYTSPSPRDRTNNRMPSSA